MKKLDIAIDALFLMLYQILSCLVVGFATWMLLKIVNTFVPIGYFVSQILYAVCLGIGVGALLVVYGYMTTYRSAAFSQTESILSSVVASVFHLLIAAVFRYAPLVSGAALPLSGLLSLGSGYSSFESQALIPGMLPPLMFLVLMAVYHTVMLFARKIALRRRLRDRYELTGT